MSLSAIAEVPSDAVQFKLKRISDGDTVVTTEDTRIRLWGIFVVRLLLLSQG
jgi:hypothetical protein